MKMTDEALSCKDEGNQHFKEGRYDDALACYTKALKLTSSEGAESAVYLKNRAACHLKLKNYKLAVSDCSKALEVVPNDPKSLFRRCQAYEEMGSFEEAYKDVSNLLRVDPKNKAIQPVLRRLNSIMQDKVKAQNSTDSRVTQMLDLVFKDSSGDEKKRKQAANNLIVLAKEEAGAELIFKAGGIDHLMRMVDGEKDRELRLTAIRVLACMACNSKTRARAIYTGVGLKKLCIWIGSADEDQSSAAANLMKAIINCITNLEEVKQLKDKKEAARKADPSSKERPFKFTYDAVDEAPEVEMIFPALIVMLHHSKVSGIGRDNAIELIIKFITRTEGLGWSVKFTEANGIQNLLEAAGTIPEHSSGLQITKNTRMHASLLLSKIYEDLISDQEREQYRNAVEAYFSDMFGDSIMESKIEAIMALAALLQGPNEVGNSILGKQGCLELIIALADSGNAVHIKYAVEALVHSASKKDKCSGVIKQATPLLKELYQSQNDAIKVRALVGLCKLGSFAGSDVTSKSFADGSTQTLAKACRKFLCNPSKDPDLRKWAAEGLAYLTLDVEVKEALCDDSDALLSLLQLTKHSDQGIVYPVAQVLVNITNSYDKKEIAKEMLDLAKYAQHHVPEEDEKDKEPYISQRVGKLVKAGVVNALVALASAESEGTRDLVSRVFLAVCNDQEHRGLVVQQGGAKALIPLANGGTDAGRIKASQALAKIAVTSNPEIAFPGQRACEVVRPLISLLAIERSALENFESLMALTNLASSSESVRRRIFKEKGIPAIEYYTYEEHEELRRAALECMCNMTMNEEVLEIYKGENDRVKLVVLLSGDEEDVKLVRATSGTLATLSRDPELCHKITTCTPSWMDVMKTLAAHPVPDIQHRGIFILLGMMCADKDLAHKLVESDLLEVLMAVSRLEDPARKMARQCAVQALERAVEWGLIKANPDGQQTMFNKLAQVEEDEEEED